MAHATSPKVIVRENTCKNTW